MFEILFVQICIMLSTPMVSMYPTKALICSTWASFCSPIVSMTLKNTFRLGQENITFNNQHFPTLSQPSKQMVVPFLWMEFCILSTISLDALTLDCFCNFCTIHGMMGVYSRFGTLRLFSQLLWTSNVVQCWKGYSLHKRNLPTSYPTPIFKNSIPLVMRPIKRFGRYYLLWPFVLFVGGV